MKRFGQLVVVLSIVILAGSWVWAGTGQGAAGPAVLKSRASRIAAIIPLICSIKDKCRFQQDLCQARCRCLGQGKPCVAQCAKKLQKCLRSFHTMDCWNASIQARIRAKYLKDCPKKPGR